MENTPKSPLMGPSFKVLSIVSAGLILLGLGNGIYSYRLSKTDQNLQTVVDAQGETIQKLSHSLDEAKQTNADLQGEVAFTKDRLGSTQVELKKARQASAMQLAKQTKQWSEQFSQIQQQQGELQQQQSSTQGTVGTLTSDVAGVKDGLNSTKEQLDSTRSDLQRVIGDLGVQSDLVAHNRDEIAELRLRGERDYYEFDVKKTKQPERVGNIAIGLKKADMKRQRFTLNLIADDRTIEKKDKTVNEPVQFYQAGFRQPSEIVVNQIYKDRIVGYVSVPKKKEPRTAQSETPAEGLKSRS